MRGYPELAIWSLMRLSSITRIGSHHFLRSVHKSWQPDREGQSATRLALDPDVAAYHLTGPRRRHPPNSATPRKYSGTGIFPNFVAGTVHSPTQLPPRKAQKARRQTV